MKIVPLLLVLSPTRIALLLCCWCPEQPWQKEEQLKQRIAFTDKKIDALVYELYGLSEVEMKIVEGATK